VTNANGRYTVSGVTGFLLFFQTDASASHRFLCDWSPIFTRGFADLSVVSSSWSGTKPVPGMPMSGGSVYGTVSEMVNGTPQPVAGAAVWLDSAMQDPEATTAANGFYMICTIVGADQMRLASALKVGYDKQIREFIGGSHSELNFQLARSR
jgi:hypothetical protein